MKCRIHARAEYGKAKCFGIQNASCELVLMQFLGNTDDGQGGSGIDSCSDSTWTTFTQVLLSIRQSASYSMHKYNVYAYVRYFCDLLAGISSRLKLF